MKVIQQILTREPNPTAGNTKYYRPLGPANITETYHIVEENGKELSRMLVSREVSYPIETLNTLCPAGKYIHTYFPNIVCPTCQAELVVDELELHSYEDEDSYDFWYSCLNCSEVLEIFRETDLEYEGRNQ